MNKNNQDREAMTKRLLYGCIKRKEKVISLEELSGILKSVTSADTIAHIFTLDMEFSDINPKNLLFNEIYSPILEENKKTSPHDWSTSQIMSRAQKKKDKDNISALPFNSKTNATLRKKYSLQFMLKICYF